MKKIYLVAVICAIIVGGATYLFAQGMANGADGGPASQKQVVVAIADVPAGTQITAQNIDTYFSISTISASSVSANSVTSVESILGKTSSGTIYSGEQVNMKRFEGGDEENAGLSYNLEDGHVAYSIAASSVAGVDGYILPGDTVDVIAIPEGKKAEVVLSDLKIIKISTNEVNSNTATPVLIYDTITLDIAEDDAKILFNVEDSSQYKSFKFVLNKKTSED